VVTVTFEDRAGQNQPLNGQYPSGVINWGSGTWFHSGPWGGFSTKSASFNDHATTAAAMTFLTPRRLVSFDAYNGGPSAASITVSCPGQPMVQRTVNAGWVLRIVTPWSGTCTTVTFGASNGWLTNFDNVAYDPGP
jgi:hypothetical protein